MRNNVFHPTLPLDILYAKHAAPESMAFLMILSLPYDTAAAKIEVVEPIHEVLSGFRLKSAQLILKARPKIVWRDVWHVSFDDPKVGEDDPVDLGQDPLAEPLV